MIFRRLPASSSFVLAAARLRAVQLDPSRTAGRPGQLRGRIQKNSQPSPAATVVTGPDPYALLTTVALMGADERATSSRICRVVHMCRDGVYTVENGLPSTLGAGHRAAHAGSQGYR
jgi:hypothetical protein